MSDFTVVDEAKMKWAAEREKVRRQNIEAVEAWLKYYRGESKLSPAQVSAFEGMLRAWCLLIEMGKIGG